MPVMTGIEMFTEMRTRFPELDFVPFIFLSAYAQKEQVELGIGIGASRYITKPVDYEVLLAAIRTLCGERDVCTRSETKEDRSEEHTSELQSLMRISYAVFCLKKKTKKHKKEI